MYISKSFIPILKNNPSEAKIKSHQLMLRVGMIKQSSAGIYSWLPLGFKVMKKIEQIVREEQNKIGAQEILIPEQNMGIEGLINSLKDSKKNGKTSSIVVVAEGDKTGKNVFDLARQVEEEFPKYEIRVSVLGHMQRGGSPSCFDRVLGTKMGVRAVESLIDGDSGKMIGIDNGKIVSTSLKKASKG